MTNQVIISCVSPNNENNFLKVNNLVKSIRKLGGALSDTRLIVNFVDFVNNEFRKSLKAYGVEIRTVKTFDKRCPHANKLRMLEIDNEYEILIGLDVDTVVVRDFSIYLEPGCIGAKIVDGTPLTLNQWKKLFNYFHLSLPTIRYLTTSTLLPVIPYFNSGVLIIPQKFVHVLRDTWGNYVKMLLDSYQNLDDIRLKSFFTDQFALSLALQATHIPIRPLPLEMNFPTHTPVHPSFSPHDISPYILHYHHKLSSNGLLKPCQYLHPNKAIKQVNQVLSLPE